MSGMGPHVRLALILTLAAAGCADRSLVGVRLSLIEIPPQTLFTTTDTVAKNELLRSGAGTYKGMTEAFRLAPERLPGLRRTVLGQFELLSLDEGIVFNRPGIYDFAPTVLRSAEGYRMCWCGGGRGGDHIFHALSDDGYLWIGARMILAPSRPVPAQEPRDSVHNGHPALLAVNDVLYLYYTGTASGTVDNEIFLAMSRNGERWIKHSAQGNPELPTPVIANTDRDGTYGVGHSSVLYKDGVFYHYYTDRRRGAGGLWLARCDDGISFAGHRQVAADIENADVKYCPELDTFFMVYGDVSDDKIFCNTSPDGVTWLPHSPERTIAVAPPENIHHNPAILADGSGHMAAETRVFYSGGIAGAGVLHAESWAIESTWISLRHRAR